jgi:hypothetical protein
MRITSLGLCLLFSLSASAQTPLPKAAVPRFTEVAKQVGLTVSHISSPEKRYIVESMSGGAGLIDCDNDGKFDIITVNGSTIDRFRGTTDFPISTSLVTAATRSIAIWATANFKMSLTKQESPAYSARAQHGPTTTVTDSSIYSFPATSRST